MIIVVSKSYYVFSKVGRYKLSRSRIPFRSRYDNDIINSKAELSELLLPSGSSLMLNYRAASSTDISLVYLEFKLLFQDFISFQFAQQRFLKIFCALFIFNKTLPFMSLQKHIEKVSPPTNIYIEFFSYFFC